jgi:hypothetical protein
VSFFTAFSLIQTKKPWSPERVSTALTFNIKDQRRKILPVRFHHHQLFKFNFTEIFFIIFSLSIRFVAHIAMQEPDVNMFF